jgi:hypothetical protein
MYISDARGRSHPNRTVLVIWFRSAACTRKTDPVCGPDLEADAPKTCLEHRADRSLAMLTGIGLLFCHVLSCGQAADTLSARFESRNIYAALQRHDREIEP